MPLQPNERYIHMHSFTVPCALHGTHRYSLAGLDHAADDAAFYLLRTLRRNRIEVEYDHFEMPLSSTQETISDDTLDVQDMPF